MLYINKSLNVHNRKYMNTYENSFLVFPCMYMYVCLYVHEIYNSPTIQTCKHVSQVQAYSQFKIPLFQSRILRINPDTAPNDFFKLGLKIFARSIG